MQWYYARDGKSFGPVEQEELVAMAKDGRLTQTDYVWNETMGDQWAKASAVNILFGGSAAEPPQPQATAVNPLTAMLNRRQEIRKEAERGAVPSTNAEITAHARASLRGSWGLAMVACLIYSLVLCAGSCIFPLIFGPMNVGLYAFFISLVRGQNPSLGMLFSGFKRFGTSLAALILMVIFSFLWILAASMIMTPLIMLYAKSRGISVDASFQPPPELGLLVSLVINIVSVWVWLRYSQTFFVLADDPTSSASEAISASKEMMAGRKWKYIFLNLRFFGWAVLCIFTLGIGFLWLAPYIQASFAKFYDEVASA